MQISLKNEVVVVTGGAKRVGRAIALECARSGAEVVITYRDSESAAHETVEEMRAIAASNAKQGASTREAKFAAFPLEVSDAREVQALQEKMLQMFGRVTALVNNAAIFRRTPFLQCDEADFDDHIAANLKGPFLLSRVFGAHFHASGGGAIVNIADIHGLRPLKNYVPYCISKAGLIMLSQGTAKALAPLVRVNCICPGTILPPSSGGGAEEASNCDAFASRDDFVQDAELLRARVPLGRLGTPEEIAQCVVFLLGGPGFISGAVLGVDGAEALR
jgi:NAD(P)-dependent dehydrogenase (short-subunit alcohol dehydrogenase family)